MIDGLWTVQTKTAEGTGGAVVMLIGGKIFGGDNAFYFTGTYRADEVSMKARVTVQNFDPAFPSIVGVESPYELEVSVSVKGDSMLGTAMLANQPAKSFGVQLSRKANI